MDIVLAPLIRIIISALSLYNWVLIAYVVIGWLLMFNVLNQSNPLVHSIGSVLNRLIEPLLQPLRRYIPQAGGLDLSFMALYFIIYFLRMVLERLYLRLIF